MNTDFVDLGATSREAKKIAKKSRKKAKKIVGDENLEQKVIQRCVIATGDSKVKNIVEFRNDPIKEIIQALKKEKPIFTDINMVKAGIINKGHNSSIESVIGEGDELAQNEGLTRTSAGFITLSNKLNDSIIVIGNAPSALKSLVEMIKEEKITPKAVIGTPVGFVGAAESKSKLRNISVPSISTTGSKGGTPIAVACINEIINLYNKQ